MTRLKIEPVADAEIIEAFEWYSSRSRAVARAFLDAIDGALVRVAETPELFPVARGDLRRAMVPRFPYAIFFVAEPDLVRVLGVIHGRRHPRRWQSRS